MVLVKAMDFEKTQGNRRIFNLRDIAQEAREMIEAARQKSDSLLEEARAEIQNRKEQARQQGHRTGHQEGVKLGREEGFQQALQEARDAFSRDSAATLNTLQNVLEEIDRTKLHLLWQAEQDTVSLALALAEKVIKKAVTPKQEYLDSTTANLKAALDLVARNTDVTVKVHPDALDHLEKMAGKNKQDLGKYKTIRFEGEEGITPGGCLLLTENGRVDAQLETQIIRLAEQLLMRDDLEPLSGGEKSNEPEPESQERKDSGGKQNGPD